MTCAKIHSSVGVLCWFTGNSWRISAATLRTSTYALNHYTCWILGSRMELQSSSWQVGLNYQLSPSYHHWCDLDNFNSQPSGPGWHCSMAIRRKGMALAALLHAANYENRLLHNSISKFHQKCCQKSPKASFSEIVEPLRQYIRYDLSKEQEQQEVHDHTLDRRHIPWQIDNSDLHALVSLDKLSHAPQNSHINWKNLLCYNRIRCDHGRLTYIFILGASWVPHRAPVELKSKYHVIWLWSDLFIILMVNGCIWCLQTILLGQSGYFSYPTHNSLFMPSKAKADFLIF